MVSLSPSIHKASGFEVANEFSDLSRHSDGTPYRGLAGELPDLSLYFDYRLEDTSRGNAEELLLLGSSLPSLCFQRREHADFFRRQSPVVDTDPGNSGNSLAVFVVSLHETVSVFPDGSPVRFVSRPSSTSTWLMRVARSLSGEIPAAPLPHRRR